MLDYYGSSNIGLLRDQDVAERLSISTLRILEAGVSEMGITARQADMGRTAEVRQHQGGLRADIDKEVG